LKPEFFFKLVAIANMIQITHLILVVLVGAQEEEERGGCFSNSKITAVS
jgi:hypothetical protein